MSSPVFLAGMGASLGASAEVLPPFSGVTADSRWSRPVPLKYTTIAKKMTAAIQAASRGNEGSFARWELGLPPTLPEDGFRGPDPEPLPDPAPVRPAAFLRPPGRAFLSCRRLFPVRLPS